MNPFILVVVAITAMFGALQTDIITSSTRKSIPHPTFVPTTSWASVLPFLTISTGNISTSLYIIPPFPQILNASNVDHTLPLVCPDLRTLDVAPVTQPDTGILGTPPAQKFEVKDIVGFLNPVALGIHPFCSLRDRSAVSETADLVLYNFTADDSLSCKLVRETFDRGVFPDLRHLDPDASTTKSESNIIVTSPKQQPGLKDILVLFNPAVLHIHDVCFLAERNAVCKVSDWHSLNASNDYVPDYNTLQVTIDHAVFQTAEIPVSEQIDIANLQFAQRHPDSLLFCELQDTRNLTCDTVHTYGEYGYYTSEEEENDDDTPAAIASNPRVYHSIIGIVMILVILWYAAERWLPQQRSLNLAQWYHPNGPIDLDAVIPWWFFKPPQIDQGWVSCQDQFDYTWTLCMAKVDALPEPEPTIIEPEISVEDGLRRQLEEQVSRNQELVDMIAQLENRHLTDAAKYQEVTRGLEAALAENKRNVAYMEPEIARLYEENADLKVALAYQSALHQRQRVAQDEAAETAAAHLRQQLVAQASDFDAATTGLQVHLDDAQRDLNVTSTQLTSTLAERDDLVSENTDLRGRLLQLQATIDRQQAELQAATSPPAAPSIDESISDADLATTNPFIPQDTEFVRPSSPPNALPRLEITDERPPPLSNLPTTSILSTRPSDRNRPPRPGFLGHLGIPIKPVTPQRRDQAVPMVEFAEWDASNPRKERFSRYGFKDHRF